MIFLWYAYFDLTIDGIIARLFAEGVTYCPSLPKWSRAKTHNILRDSAYVGEVRYQGQWHTEYRDRMATLSLQLEAADRQRDEEADLAAKVFELSQGLTERWVSAEYAAKRQILELVCLNFKLHGVTLVPEMRKPFDQLIEGLHVSSSRGDKI